MGHDQVLDAMTGGLNTAMKNAKGKKRHPEFIKSIMSPSVGSRKRYCRVQRHRTAVISSVVAGNCCRTGKGLIFSQLK